MLSVIEDLDIFGSLLNGMLSCLNFPVMHQFVLEYSPKSFHPIGALSQQNPRDSWRLSYQIALVDSGNYAHNTDYHDPNEVLALLADIF